MGRMGVAGSDVVEGGSVLHLGFEDALRTKRILACRRCIEVLQLVLFERHLQTKNRHA